MKKYDIFPISVLEFEYPSLLNWAEMDAYLSSQIRYRGPSGLGHTHNQLHKEAYLTKLVSWFRMCLDDARNTYSFACEELSITTCWANCSWGNAGLQHHAHDHPMSCISGIFYASNTSTPTVFENPYYTHKVGRIEPYRMESNHNWTAPSSPGTLLLFPSGLVHQTIPHDVDINRWSISFNTLPTGEINNYCGGYELTAAQISIPN